MKRLLVFVFSVLNMFVLVAQQKKFAVSWSESVNVSTIKKPLLVPGFNEANFSFSPVTGIKYGNRLKVDGTVDLNSVRLQNVVYENVNSQTLLSLKPGLIPEEHNLTASNSSARGTDFFEFNFAPIIRSNGVVKRVTSFAVSYNTTQALRSSQSKSPVITNSIFASGKYYKFYVDTTGVFKIDRDFLRDLGMGVNSVNPQNLKIYGDGGAMLPLLNRDNTVFDPQENAIKVMGGDDGSFDTGDYILFYGEGTRKFNAESLTHINAYDDRSYYFITADGGAGLRVQSMQQPEAAASQIITTYDAYQFHELDQENLLNLGRRWFGEHFDIENEQQFVFDFPNRIASDPVSLRVYVAAISESQTSFSVGLNGASVVDLSMLPINESILAQDASYDSFDRSSSNTAVAVSGDRLTVSLNYNNNGNPSSVGYLDFIALGARCRLSGYGAQFGFSNAEAATVSGVGLYQFSNATEFSEVWDVTNINAVTSVENENSSADFSFKAQLGAERKYVAINPDDFYIPKRENGNASVANQNIKGSVFQQNGSFQDVDYLIVTSAELRAQAERLAQHNRTYRGLRVQVLTLNEIYNEFSSGKQDIGAIRNLVRYVYENASSSENRLKYLCLMGDTSFDYKDRIAGSNNIVPTFNTYYSFSQSQSYMSDDYFGSLDPREGIIENNSPAGSGGSDRLDVAVGRILADTPQLANEVISKIINYDSQASLGRWHNDFVLVSDDVDLPWEFDELQSTINALGDQIQEEKPFINVKKIHSDSYQQQSSAGGDRYPEVNEAIINALEAGSLVMTYLGHGGENTLASEFIFTRENARNLNNKDKLPVIVTVTCEFTRFDNPNRTAAGEELFWNANGGAVGLVATTREISVRLGVRFNRQLVSNLFSFGTNEIKSVAENLRETKNQINDDNRRVIFFIGDPAMKLAFAEPDIKLTALNDVPITQNVDTLKALSRIKMSGEVVDLNGQRISNYNGELSATVYDKYIERQTLGNDGTTDVNGNLLVLNFKALGAILYRGQASVTNGVFDLEFVVPKDAAIPLGNGRVNFYSKRTGSVEDQAGANEQIIVGGLNENAPDDNEGPLINLYMNDENFVNGGVTNTSPTLLVKLEDENGINTAGGIGHDLIASIDGDEENPIILNEFYESDVDNFNLGRALRTLRDLDPGLHTVTVIAWDTYNNSSTADLQFVVAGDEELQLERVLNYPNPFVNYTEFWFNHNRPYEPLEVQVQIFTVTGKVVKTINQLVTTTGFLSREITWNGLDDFGQKIGKGVYVYKITVKSTLTNKKVEKFEKLVIL
ncbi:type IX secretion system sortase PorU [Leeuwenhoekiella marinoflava]|uniref:Por secretion system C-terminal sorting domain-containing protein n=2 Tax=Leeuwenhoekiella marinoflava TaxID=988 RepID=A0ABY1HUQ7_9FLAO|nr:type IX secretion system sortase PorU [Leeuwenhoekiella marinoflava]RXG27944.1 putative secreted protein (Por secretion system target) [Leeuwenhoekiella marinoflava]SHF60614.1 Por secretion system C-terminal sorting domain-containing protein [Leeuwenhoekiella marinoflava DSM 3653]